MLVLNNIEVMYLNVILVLKGVSLEVPDGKIIALWGGSYELSPSEKAIVRFEMRCV